MGHWGFLLEELKEQKELRTNLAGGSPADAPATGTRRSSHLPLPVVILLWNPEAARAPIPDAPEFPSSGSQESGKGAFRQDTGR